jgi:hypothetical protein
MKVFSYSYFYRFLYRYGNIPVTLILLVYILAFAASLHKGYFYYIFFIIIAALIYKINKFYLTLYKIVPVRFTLEDEQIVCSGYIFRKKKTVNVKYADIGRLEGGVFDRKFTGLMKIYDTHNNICIGFFQQLKDARVFETFLLNKVPKEVYDAVSIKMGLKIEKQG